jgi:hypothetical protein
MIVRQVCAKCGKLLGHVELHYNVKPDTVSHGLCKEHADELLRELAAYKGAPDEVPGV